MRVLVCVRFGRNVNLFRGKPREHLREFDAYINVYIRINDAAYT